VHVLLGACNMIIVDAMFKCSFIHRKPCTDPVIHSFTHCYLASMFHPYTKILQPVHSASLFTVAGRGQEVEFCVQSAAEGWI